MKIDINVKFNAKRKYIVNGKEYGSIEEMPANIRRVYEKAADSLGTNLGASPGNTKKEIMFNGQKYENAEAMPPDVRQMYDELIMMVEMDRVSPGAVAEKPISFGFSKSTTPEPAIPPRLLTFSIILLVFLGILYFFYQKARGH